MSKAKRAPATPATPEHPRVFEMFIDPTFEVQRTASYHEVPSAFNGTVRLRRFRVTIEPIEESIEVLRARLIKLWRDTERNQHYYTPIHSCAASLGMTPEDIARDLAYDAMGANRKSHPSRP